MRAHALPLPYITIPSLSWLVHLSTQAYLAIRRNPSAAPPVPASPFLPSLDVPFEHIRSYIGTHPRKPGVTIASLILSSEGPRLPLQSDELGLDGFVSRPTSAFGLNLQELSIVFPVLERPGSQGAVEARFYLDFTDGGKYPGVIMSQTRMREIETLVNPLAGIDQIDNVPLMSTTFGAGSWVDLLVRITFKRRFPECSRRTQICRLIRHHP